jgi:hypothetical protein
MDEEFGFDFAGKRVSAAKFKPAYISEFKRVLETWCKDHVSNILDWGSGLTTQILAAHAEHLPAIQLFLSIDSKWPLSERDFCRSREARVPHYRVARFNGTAKPVARTRLFHLSVEIRAEIRSHLHRRMAAHGVRFYCHALCHEKTIVVVHDYRRLRYQPILTLFDLIEEGREFRVLKSRPSVLSAVANSAGTQFAYSENK